MNWEPSKTKNTHSRAHTNTHTHMQSHVYALWVCTVEEQKLHEILVAPGTGAVKGRKTGGS